MKPTDTLLSLSMGLHDCYYRFRRDLSHTRTVVYVHVQSLDILPENCQTYGPDIIRELRESVEAWDQHWTTLTVFKAHGKIQSIQDEWKPHYLPPDVLLDNLPRLNILDLKVERKLKNRVSKVHHGTLHIFKDCPFVFELPYMTQELRAYKVLLKRGCTLIPTIAAYVYERSEDHVIGFICEEFHGPFAKPDDLEDCRRSLRKLHSHGIVHGDLNKFNMIMTADGPRFFDLERAIIESEDSIPKEEFSRLQEEEFNGLENALCNEEGWGKPWL